MAEATKLLDTLDEEERRIRKQAFEDACSEANDILCSFIDPTGQKEMIRMKTIRAARAVIIRDGRV